MLACWDKKSGAFVWLLLLWVANPVFAETRKRQKATKTVQHADVSRSHSPRTLARLKKRRLMLNQLRKIGLISKKPLPTLQHAMRQCPTWMKIKFSRLSMKPNRYKTASMTPRRSAHFGKLYFRPPRVTFREAWYIPTSYTRHRMKMTYRPMQFYYARSVSPQSYGYSASRTMRAVRRQWRSFMYCYENTLKSNRTIQGKISFSVEVGTQGRVESVRMVQNQTDLSLQLCLTRRIKNLRFPRFSEKVTFVLPLLFSSRK